VVRIPKKTREEARPMRLTYETSAYSTIRGAAAHAMSVLEMLIICGEGSNKAGKRGRSGRGEGV
jgi:hypothetical protein